MKVTIYNEPKGGTIGGCEVSVAVLAAGLAAEHEVEIVHYRPNLTRELLAEFADVDLSRVRLRLGPVLEPQRGSPWKVIARMRKEGEQETDIGGDCDVFISFNHETPVFTKAPLAILVVLFPFTTPESMVQRQPDPAPLVRIREAWQRRWHKWKLRSRLRNYSVRLAISEFSRTWTKSRWGIESGVLYPPVKVGGAAGDRKGKLILSVGRFAVDGHGKKQIEMLQAFRKLRDTQGTDWDYDCVGACGSSAQERLFLDQVRVLARESGASVAANLNRGELEDRYRRASIFWHATGMDVNEQLQPEKAEHFGITTVEAMAAGCVPVVIKRGAQPEIVEHGINGFLWETTEELVTHTFRLQEDASLLRKMSEAAKARAAKFSRGAFVGQFEQILSQSKDRSASR